MPTQSRIARRTRSPRPDSATETSSVRPDQRQRGEVAQLADDEARLLLPGHREHHLEGLPHAREPAEAGVEHDRPGRRARRCPRSPRWSSSWIWPGAGADDARAAGCRSPRPSGPGCRGRPGRAGRPRRTRAPGSGRTTGTRSRSPRPAWAVAVDGAVVLPASARRWSTTGSRCAQPRRARPRRAPSGRPCAGPSRHAEPATRSRGVGDPAALVVVHVEARSGRPRTSHSKSASSSKARSSASSARWWATVTCGW